MKYIFPVWLIISLIFVDESDDNEKNMQFDISVVPYSDDVGFSYHDYWHRTFKIKQN